MGETVKRYRSIVTRLALMVTGILVMAVLVVGSLALLGQLRQLHQALGTKATTLVQFLAQVTPLGILSLNFVEMNNNVRKVVLTDDEAVYAVILNEQQIPLAYFFKDTNPLVTNEVRDLVKNRKPLAAIEVMKHAGRIREVTAPITAGERHIGAAILGFSSEKMRRALLTQITVIGTVLVVIIGLSIALLKAVLRRMLHPVQELTAAATRISTGDLSVVLTGTDRSDELGVLSRTFGGMTDQLRGLIAGLEQRMAELKQASQALQESEAKYRRIVDTATEGIWVLGPDTMTTFVNARMAEMLGCREEEIIGRPLTDFMFEEDVSDHFRKMENRRQGASEHYERRFRHKDGETVWILASATPVFDAGNRFGGSFAMVTDITERKKDEEKLRLANLYNRSLIEASLDPLVTIGADGIITDANAATEAATGRSRAELVGTDFCDYFTEAEKARAGYQQAFREGLVKDYALELRHRDGRVISVLYNASVYRDEQGKVIGVFAAARDITERKRAEEALQKLNQELDQRVKERTAELEAKNAELERINKVFVGRELRMVELKERIRELEEKLERGTQ